MSEDKRLNEVIRVKKRPNNFVMMDKSFLENEKLSYKAKGILAYLLGKPDNWKVIIGNLVNYSTDGKASVYAGLKELKESGYYEKKPIRDNSGQRIVRWESIVYEMPNSLLTDFQEIENLEIENQFIENREHNNNYINKDLYINNNHVKSSQRKEDRQGQPDVNAYLNTIKENIQYDDLLLTNQEDIKLIDEFIDIILDTLMSQGRTVRISGENKPRELVKHNLIRLTYEDILHVLRQFKSHEGQIKKKHQYILTMLYHSKLELEAHNTNLVNTDWGS
jgi:hypothetical protein